MKKKRVLHIVRHAKSSWDYENIADYDRPLKLRGIKNAYEMARRIKIRNSLPELIISSPANRALHTAVIFAKVLELPYNKITIDTTLYGTDPDKIAEAIRHTGDAICSVMVFGHNPDFTELANAFLKEHIGEIPTTGIVSISFKSDSWSDIGKDNVTDVYIDFPKKDLQVESM